MDDKGAGLLNRKCKRTMLGAFLFDMLGVKVLISDPKCISSLYVISHHPDSLSGDCLGFLELWWTSSRYIRDHSITHIGDNQTMQMHFVFVYLWVSTPKLGPTKMPPALCQLPSSWNSAKTNSSLERWNCPKCGSGVGPFKVNKKVNKIYLVVLKIFGFLLLGTWKMDQFHKSY